MTKRTVTMKLARPKSSELKAIHAALDEHGYTVKSFCAHLGWPVYRFQRQANAGFPSPEHRAEIEAGFDYKFSLWSSVAELDIRKRLRDTRGYDPSLLFLPELKNMARGFGLPTEEVPRQELLRALLAKLAVNQAP